MKTKKILILGVSIFVMGVGIFTVKAMNGNVNNNTKTINFIDNKEVSVEYLTTRSIANTGDLEIYLDDSKNEYVYSNNQLVGYLKNVDLSTKKVQENTKSVTSTKDLLQTYKSISDNLLTQIINSNSKRSVKQNEYEINYTHYRDDYREYVYTYTNKIGGYNTNDSITISLDENGELSSFNATRQGMFDQYENIKIDKNDVNTFIENSMVEFLNGTTDTYDVYQQLINFNNGKLVLEIVVEIFHENSEYAYNTTVLKYEL